MNNNISTAPASFQKHTTKTTKKHSKQPEKKITQNDLRREHSEEQRSAFGCAVRSISFNKEKRHYWKDRAERTFKKEYNNALSEMRARA